MVAESAKCIGTNLHCAALCATTGKMLSRHTSPDADLTCANLETCHPAATACAEECEQRAEMYEHCRICAVSRRSSERSCKG